MLVFYIMQSVDIYPDTTKGGTPAEPRHRLPLEEALPLSKPGDDDPPSPGLTWEHYLHNKDEHDVTMATRVINAFL